MKYKEVGGSLKILRRGDIFIDKSYISLVCNNISLTVEGNEISVCSYRKQGRSWYDVINETLFRKVNK